EEAPATLIPASEGQHPVEPLEAVVTVCLIGGENDLRVALCSEAPARLLELFPESSVVVDLAVIGEYECAVLVGHRLLAPDQIDDFQAASPEADVVIFRKPDALLVRPSVDDGIAHPDEESGFELALLVNNYDETAHQDAPAASAEYASITLRAFSCQL